jgi:hypothetical protein
MSKRAFNKIMQGIGEARAYLDGTADKGRYRVHVPEKVDVKKIRTRLGLSQENFAQTYGFALSAVRGVAGWPEPGHLHARKVVVPVGAVMAARAHAAGLETGVPSCTGTGRCGRASREARRRRGRTAVRA